MSASALQSSISSSQMMQFHYNPKSWCCVTGQLHAGEGSGGVSLRQRAVNAALPKWLRQEQTWEGALAVLSPAQPSLLHCETRKYIFHVGQEIKQRYRERNHVADVGNETKFPDCQASANVKSPYFPWYTLLQFTLWSVFFFVRDSSDLHPTC